MAGPWENYAPQADATPSGGRPWEKYQSGDNGEEPKSVLRDVIEQIPQGFNRGVDATYNLPNNALNFAARLAGYGPVVEPVKLATRFNYENDQPQTAAGRYAGAVGEQLGANTLPGLGMVARGENALATGLNALYSSAGGGVSGEAAKDLGGNALTQTAVSIGGSLAGPNAINALLARGPADPRLVEKTLAAQAAQQEGIDVPRIAVANSLLKPVGGRLASIPLVGSPIQNAARTSLDQTGERVAQIANDYGSGNRATAGANLRDGLVDYIDTGSRQPINRLYNQVDFPR